MTEKDVSVNDRKNDLTKQLVQKNVNHYISIFELSDNDRRADWNWCAFFVAPMWFAYRKMYVWAAICWLAPCFISFLVGLLGQGTAFDLIDLGLTIAFACFMATKANTFYKDRIDLLISQMPNDEVEKDSFIKKKGGTSKLAVVIVLAINVVSEAVMSFVVANIA